MIVLQDKKQHISNTGETVETRALHVFEDEKKCKHNIKI